jgi:hypothetical protein
MIHQIKLSRSFIGRMIANITQVERPSLFARSLLSPLAEITLLAVMLPMATLVRWGDLLAAP